MTALSRKLPFAKSVVTIRSPAVKPGGGAMMDCLIDHQADISEDCYQLLKAKLQSGK
jgi:hypothetical protein